MPWRDAPTIGNLLGTRMVLNEFVAYSQLGPLKATLDPQVVHDRDVRAVRLRQLQLDRHPDRRHRRAGAEPPPRSGAARPARDVRRHAGQLHDRDDRRVSLLLMRLHVRRQVPIAMLTEREWLLRQVRSGRRRRACRVPRSRSCSARGWATSPTRSATRSSMPYDELPHWPASRVIGHEGRLVVGTVRGQDDRRAGGPRATSTKGTIAGRSTFAVRVLGLLGVKTLILTNAAGGVNTELRAGRADGDRRSHQPDGQQPARRRRTTIGSAPRFPDMTEVYSSRLRADRRSRRAGDRACRCRTASTSALLGPSYETPAEIRYLRTIGADAVGMSTVPGGDRRAPHGHGGARHLVHHQHGGRRAAAAARSRRGDGDGAPRPRSVHRAAGGHHWPPLTPTWRRTRRLGAARRREHARRGVLELQGRRRARDRRRHGHHRLQHRERDLRPDDLRRARRDVQGALGRAPRVHAHRRSSPTPTRRRRRAARAARSCGSSAATSRSCSPTCTEDKGTHRLKDLLPLPFDARLL